MSVEAVAKRTVVKFPSAEEIVAYAKGHPAAMWEGIGKTVDVVAKYFAGKEFDLDDLPNQVGTAMLQKQYGRDNVTHKGLVDAIGKVPSMKDDLRIQQSLINADVINLVWASILHDCVEKATFPQDSEGKYTRVPPRGVAPKWLQT